MLEGSTAIIFYIIAFVMIMTAIGVAALKNIFHAALLLVLTLFCVAAIYILLSAEFLAAVQVLIYVGAVSVLLIFAVMLTSQLTNYNIKQSNEQTLPALFISVCFIVLVIFAIVTNLKVGGFPLAENPERTLPRALLSAIIISIIIYSSVAFSAVLILPWLSLSRSSAPLSLVAERIFGFPGLILMTFSGALATLTTLNSAVATSSYILYAMSRDEYLPNIFKKTYLKIFNTI